MTLVGPGGVGKTRLAQALLAADPLDGRLFVRLADCRELEEVRGKVAAALQINRSAAIARALAARGRLLLVLDDCEQLPAEVAARVASWLDSAPELAVVVTCRQPLGAKPEEVVQLDGLPIDAAVALLIARGRAARGSLSPFPELQDLFSSIVVGLDRLPPRGPGTSCSLRISVTWPPWVCLLARSSSPTPRGWSTTSRTRSNGW